VKNGGNSPLWSHRLLEITSAMVLLIGVAVAQTTRPPFSSTDRTFIKQSNAR